MFVGLPLALLWEFMTTLLSLFQTESNSVSKFQVLILVILGFQLVQEKIVKIMSNTQAIFLLCFRISNLIDQGKATMGQIAMTKAWVT